MRRATIQALSCGRKVMAALLLTLSAATAAEAQPFLKEYKTKTVRASAGFTPRKTEIVLGEPLPVTFSIKNVGTKEFGYWFGGDYRGVGRHEKFGVVVTDAAGNGLRDPRGGMGNFGGISSVWPVKPGKTSTHELELTDFRTFEKPGEYTVRCAFGLKRGGPNLEELDETAAFTVETTFRLKVLPRTEANVRRALAEYVKQARRDKGDALTWAVGVACSFGGERAVPDLAALAAEGDAEHRVAALTGLARFTTPTAVEAALKAQRDPEAAVRIAAANALGTMKTPAAVAGLLKRLPAEGPKVLAALLPALGRTRSPRALKPLVQALDHESVDVRRAAAAGLGELQSEQALTALQRCATDDDLQRRDAVVTALNTKYKQPVRPEWVVPVIRAGKRYPSATLSPQLALDLLYFHGDATSPPALIRCLDFKDPAPSAYSNLWIFGYLYAGYLEKLPGAPRKLFWHREPQKPAQIRENWATLRQLKNWLVAQSKAEDAPPAPRRPVPTAAPAIKPAVARLIEQLGSKKFAERDAAGKALIAAGDDALDALLWAAARGADLETRRRASLLLDVIEQDFDRRRLDGHKDVVRSVAWAPDGSRAAYLDLDGALWMRDARTGKDERFPIVSGRLYAVAVSPDGKRLLAGCDDVVAVTHEKTGQQVRFLKGHTGVVPCVAFSPDSTRALSGGDDATARLWDIAEGKELRRFRGHTDGVTSVAFSPDGRRVLTASLDGTVRLWDAASGNPLRCLRGHRDAVWSATFLPDGKRVLTASGDRTLRLWDLDSGRELRRFLGHSDSVYTVALASGGRQFVSGGHDGTARLWELDSGTELRRLRLPRGWVETVAVAPDGRRALVGGSAGYVRIWELRK